MRLLDDTTRVDHAYGICSFGPEELEQSVRLYTDQNQEDHLVKYELDQNNIKISYQYHKDIHGVYEDGDDTQTVYLLEREYVDAVLATPYRRALVTTPFQLEFSTGLDIVAIEVITLCGDSRSVKYLIYHDVDLLRIYLRDSEMRLLVQQVGEPVEVNSIVGHQISIL